MLSKAKKKRLKPHRQATFQNGEGGIKPVISDFKPSPILAQNQAII